ncbi:hypothetical protein VIGAN_05267300, partial [Vigna angularis var. angularis]
KHCWRGKPPNQANKALDQKNLAYQQPDTFTRKNASRSRSTKNKQQTGTPLPGSLMKTSTLDVSLQNKVTFYT